MRILVILFALFIVLMTHEMGHFAAMRAFGIEVKEVAVGIGPVVHATEFVDGTPFTFRMLPLGGFTQPVEESMANAGLLQVLLVYIAGMLGNVLCGMMCFIAAATIWSPIARERGVTRPFRWSFTTAFGTWLTFPPTFFAHFFLRPRKLFRSLMGPLGLLVGASSNDDETSGEDGGEKKEPQAVPAGYGVLMLIGQLSVIVAGANLLPLAPLDGGMMVALLIGAFVHPDLALGFIAISMSMFFILFLFVFFLDILRVVKRVRRPPEE